MVVFGSKLYGKVDHVPGVFHVATQFHHVNFVPLLPIATYLVYAQDGDQWTGVKIPFSFKSMMIAWLRFATSAAVVVYAFLMIVAVQADVKNPPKLWDVIPMLLAYVAMLIGGYFLPGVGRATRTRMAELGKHADLSLEEIDYVRLTGRRPERPEPKVVTRVIDLSQKP